MSEPFLRIKNLQIKVFNKKEFLLLGLIIFFLPEVILAANLYWVGGEGGNVSDRTNWSTTNPTACNPGGGNASSAPGTADVAIFDPDCDNGATIDLNWSILGIQIQSGYSGTITQSANYTITVGTSGWTQADGTFIGGTGNITIDGDYNISGGSFTSTSGILQVNRSFIQTGSPTWNANAGTVNFGGAYDGGDTTVDAPGITFNLVTINRTMSASYTRTFTIAANTTIPLGNSPTITLNNTSVYYHLTNNGTITVSGGTGMTINVKGNFTNNGTLTANTITTLTMNGSIVNSGTISLTSATTLDFNTYNYYIASYTGNSGSSLLTASSPTFNIEGSLVVASGATFPSNATVNFDGAYADGNTTVDAPGITFNLVTINRTIYSSSARTFTIAANTTIPLGNSPTMEQ